jgi:glucosamine kinase
MQKQLIADSGATKTDWLYFDGETFTQIQTQGLHPAGLQEREDGEDLRKQVGHLSPDLIHFYGTGCGNPESDQKLKDFLNSVFPGVPEITVDSDLDGSGKAFFGDGNGVVAVLGTGAISARIEDGSIKKKSAALGYAIGDEGSAADLGRRLLRILYRETASSETIRFISQKLNETGYAEMMNRIYTSPKPNRELASVAGEVLQTPYPEELNEMIRDAFGDFIRHQLSTLNLSEEEPVVFTGKVAQVHRNLLKQVMAAHGYRDVRIVYPVIEAWKKRLKNS